MAKNAVAAYNREIVQRYQETRHEIERELKEIRRKALADPMGTVRFCILTPQVAYERVGNALAQLKSNSVLRSPDRVVAVLRQNGVRFPNKKADYLVKTVDRESELERLLQDTDDHHLRELLRGSFKGLGLKEATHFLRDLGRADGMAILDRWVLWGMEKAGRIDKEPKNVGQAKYYRLEKAYLKWADDLDIPPKHLDLLLFREGKSLVKDYRLEKIRLKWADDLRISPEHLDRLLLREMKSLDDDEEITMELLSGYLRRERESLGDVKEVVTMGIPANITRDDMIWAIIQIDIGHHHVPKSHRSDRYCLEYRGRKYGHFPPKEVVRLANTYRNGEELKGFHGGNDTNNFCRKRGFIVVSHGGAPH